MSPFSSVNVAETLERTAAEVLELMCFAMVDESSGEERPALEAEARVAFRGPTTGELRIRAYGDVIGELAEGMVADDELAQAECLDAWGEVGNVLCGGVLPVLHPDGIYDLAAPAVATEASETQLTAVGACEIEVDGGVVSVELFVAGVEKTP
ncbi:MAG: chemotaxis protein CheX [Myxococcota bacterium]